MYINMRYCCFPSGECMVKNIRVVDTCIIRYAVPRCTPPSSLCRGRWKIRRWLKRRSKSKIYTCRHKRTHTHARRLKVDGCIKPRKSADAVCVVVCMLLLFSAAVVKAAVIVGALLHIVEMALAFSLFWLCLCAWPFSFHWR